MHFGATSERSVDADANASTHIATGMPPPSQSRTPLPHMAPSKSRRPSPPTATMYSFVKRLRTSLFTLQTTLTSRSISRVRLAPRSCRHPLAVTLAIVVCISILALTCRALSLWHVHVPILSHFFALRLQHTDLRVSPAHFQPPSLFAPEMCVRQYDQAWALSQTGDTSDPKQFARIAYAIQASGDTVQLLPRLLSRIYHSRNVYVIHLDAKVASEKRAKFARFLSSQSAYRGNVHLMRSEMLTYRGISTVLNSLALMSRALDEADWDYYINISASDYPLLSVDDIAAMLVRPKAPPGALNFVWFFPRKDWTPYSFRIRQMFWDPAASGQQSAKTHLQYMPGQKENPMEAHRAFVFTKAEAWSILSRQFVLFLIRSSFAKRMLLAHMHVLSVSEHFVTDTLFNHPVWRATVVPEAFRKVVWYFRGRRSGQHPYTLDAGPSKYSFWQDIEESSCIFARKMSQPNSALMDRIDAEISGVGLNTSDPRFIKFERSRRVFLTRVVAHFDQLTKLTLKQQNIEWPTSAYPHM